jgi:hypothetical protein
MAQLDTSIYNVRPKSVEDYNAEADAAEARKMGAQSNRLALALQGRQMAQMERADRDEMDLKAALAGAKSQDDVIGILRGRGRFEQADKLETSAMNRKKTDSELKTADLTRTESAFKHYRDALGTVQDARQAEAFVVSSYNDPIVGPMLQRMGSLEDGLARLRQAAATPEGFRDWQAKASVGIQKLAEMAKVQQVDTGGKVSTQVYNPVTGAVNTVATAQKTMTPGETASNAVAWANNAVAREGNEIKRSEVQMGGKPPPGYQWSSPGVLQAIPGGPGDKLPERQQNQVVGVQNLSGAIKEYRDQLSNWSKLDTLSPDARAAMGTKYNNMMLQAKEAYNLGVLNGPDLSILESVITRPTSMAGVVTSRTALDAQAAELDRIMNDIAAVTANRRPQDAIKPPAPAAPRSRTPMGPGRPQPAPDPQGRPSLDSFNRN